MTGTKTTIAMFGGAAALAFAVGFGGVGVNPLGNATPPSPHAAPSATAPAPAKAAPGVQFATLTGCVAGLNC